MSFRYPLDTAGKEIRSLTSSPIAARTTEYTRLKVDFYYYTFTGHVAKKSSVRGVWS